MLEPSVRNRAGFLAGLALALGTSGCQATTGKASVFAPPADTIQCSTSFDRKNGERLATGLVVSCTVQVDSAGTYNVNGQLVQDRRQGTASFANARGNDMSRSAVKRGRSTQVQAAKPGPLLVELWFPGSELNRRARRGEAWIDVQVVRLKLPESKTAVLSPAPKWFRGQVKVNPTDFVRRLPGKDIPPSLAEYRDD